ncbi:MAG: SDR family oxidoreductase [Planctomycetes bacterium]|nr:SDR family oxidoreductase [Planctomycetota bacterium]
MDFENRVALITGASGTIGLGIAKELQAQGAKVFLTDLDQAKLDECCNEIDPSGQTAKSLAGNITEHEQVKAIVAAAIEGFGGKIDVLMNVAGVTGEGNKVEDITPGDWDFIYAVNCKGTFLFVKEVVPVMKASGGGAIVNFSSKSGKTGSAVMSAYSSAKGAIIAFTQALAFELAPSNIRVNCVCPGITEGTGVWSSVSTAYQRTMGQSMEELVKTFSAKVPLKRLAKIEEVVNVTVFLASDKAGYMTGQAINITGGREMH